MRLFETLREVDTFDYMTDDDIQEVENWINGYPREIHGFMNSGQLFAQELEKIGL